MDHIFNSLTIEQLGDKFTNKFELVNYAIKLAQNMIRSGRECRIPTTVQNPAFWVLLEIDKGKDVFDDITDVNEEEKQTETKEDVVRKASERSK